MLLARKFEHQSEGERGLYAMAGGGGGVGVVRFFFFEAMRILFPDYHPGRNGEYGSV